MASRSASTPGMGAYWLLPPRIAAETASTSAGSQSKSGKPWERLMAPCSFARRVITAKIDTPTSGSFEPMVVVDAIEEQNNTLRSAKCGARAECEVLIEPLASADDREWCAQLMAASEPWLTLRRDLDACRVALANPVKERYVVRDDGERAGLLVLDMTGPFPGYIQSICIAPGARNRGLGTQVLAWAETRILRDSPNVFMCVSSFNPDALRLYRRVGYEVVGTLKGFVVDEHDEFLLQKRRSSWEAFRATRT